MAPSTGTQLRMRTTVRAGLCIQTGRVHIVVLWRGELTKAQAQRTDKSTNAYPVSGLDR